MHSPVTHQTVEVHGHVDEEYLQWHSCVSWFHGCTVTSQLKIWFYVKSIAERFFRNRRDFVAQIDPTANCWYGSAKLEYSTTIWVVPLHLEIDWNKVKPAKNKDNHLPVQMKRSNFPKISFSIAVCMTCFQSFKVDIISTRFHQGFIAICKCYQPFDLSTFCKGL